MFFFRYNIMKKCWETQPKDRPSFAELVKMLSKLLQSPKDRPPAPPARPGNATSGIYPVTFKFICFALMDVKIITMYQPIYSGQNR